MGNGTAGSYAKRGLSYMLNGEMRHWERQQCIRAPGCPERTASTNLGSTRAVVPVALAT